MASIFLANPAKKLARKGSKKPAAKRAHTKARRYKRNPIAAGGGSLINTVKNGAIGAAGAFAVDVVMAKVPQLAAIGTPKTQPIIKGLVGMGIGMAVSRFGKNKALGVALAEGAVTVQLHSLLRANVGASFGLAGVEDDYMGAYGFDFEDANYAMSEFVDEYGETVSGGELLGSELLGMGSYTNAAPVMSAYTN